MSSTHVGVICRITHTWKQKGELLGEVGQGELGNRGGRCSCQMNTNKVMHENVIMNNIYKELQKAEMRGDSQAGQGP